MSFQNELRLQDWFVGMRRPERCRQCHAGIAKEVHSKAGGKESVLVISPLYCIIYLFIFNWEMQHPEI